MMSGTGNRISTPILSFDGFNFLLRALSSFLAFRFGGGLDVDAGGVELGVETLARRAERLEGDFEVPLYAKWDIEARKADEEERSPDI